MAGDVKSKISRNTADIGDFFQIGVHLLIAQNRQDLTGIAARRQILVFLHNRPCRRKEGNPGLGIGFLPVSENPRIPITINALDNLGSAKFLNICISEAGVARKEKDIADEV